MRCILPLLLFVLAGHVSAQPRGAASVVTGGTISVQGVGTLSTAPTFASLTAGVTTRESTADRALAVNNAAVAAVLSEARAFGIADEDLRTINFSIYPQYSNTGETVVAYQVSNQVSMRTTDLGRLGELLDALVGAGASNIFGPQFGVDEVDQLRDQAIAAAIADARARAEVIAAAAEVTLGGPISIDTLGQINPFRGADLAFAAEGAGSVPIEIGQNQITARISVVFSILR